jgi:deoxyribodipyrimidine photo-lyase
MAFPAGFDEVGGAPALRVRAENGAGVRRAPEADLVVYWMIAARRPTWSFALDRALAWSRHLGLPVVVLEALRVDYPWASDRLHRFVLDGMADNARAFAGTSVHHLAYVEPSPHAGRGLLAQLAARAAVVVTDRFPCFFLPRMVEAAAASLPVRLESVDGNGILPLACHPRDFTAAAHFRRHAQRLLPAHLLVAPHAHPLAHASHRRSARVRPAVLDEVLLRWPAASRELLSGQDAALAALPIDHQVPAVSRRGGCRAAATTLDTFLARALAGYADDRDHPDLDATSHLSPYLHFGHVSPHQVFAKLAEHEGWTPDRLGPPAGARRGFFGMSEPAEAFLDQLITWRELAYNTCAQRSRDYHRYPALPGWARTTLEAHQDDPRPHRYSRARLEAADTHDALWNAAMNQLRREGWFHNYMRMLWGKKILEWSRSPAAALGTMIELMNRWSLDGRDPASYAGYAWVLGRYDRPWPERPIFGQVRTMTSASAARKLQVKRYVATYAPAE